MLRRLQDRLQHRRRRRQGLQLLLAALRRGGGGVALQGTRRRAVGRLARARRPVTVHLVVGKDGAEKRHLELWRGPSRPHFVVEGDVCGRLVDGVRAPQRLALGPPYPAGGYGAQLQPVALHGAEVALQPRERRRPGVLRHREVPDLERYRVSGRLLGVPCLEHHPVRRDALEESPLLVDDVPGPGGVLPHGDAGHGVVLLRDLHPLAHGLAGQRPHLAGHLDGVLFGPVHPPKGERAVAVFPLDPGSAPRPVVAVCLDRAANAVEEYLAAEVLPSQAGAHRRLPLRRPLALPQDHHIAEVDQQLRLRAVVLVLDCVHRQAGLKVEVHDEGLAPSGFGPQRALGDAPASEVRAPLQVVLVVHLGGLEDEVFEVPEAQQGLRPELPPPVRALQHELVRLQQAIEALPLHAQRCDGEGLPRAQQRLQVGHQHPYGRGVDGRPGGVGPRPGVARRLEHGEDLGGRAVAPQLVRGAVALAEHGDELLQGGRAREGIYDGSYLVAGLVQRIYGAKKFHEVCR
mmetsp:Transcript_79633/g.225425  ORF Transcript_79633/g.225425 Transcript_79633/m.225425 type:complete len:517 (-) Transcript_79633:173-1723(-)